MAKSSYKATIKWREELKNDKEKLKKYREKEAERQRIYRKKMADAAKKDEELLREKRIKDRIRQQRRRALLKKDFRPTKRIYKKRPQEPTIDAIDIDIASSSFKYDEQSLLENQTAESGNNFCNINATSLGSNESLSRDSFSILPTATIVPDTIKVKVETEEYAAHGLPEKDGTELGTTFEGNNSEDETIYNIQQNATLHNLSNQPADNFIEPSSVRISKLANSTFNDSYPQTFKEPRRKRKKTVPLVDARQQPMPIDPLDENTSTSKNDYFEQWSNKKKQLLEIEMLELRNYKFKLEMWEKEQHLNVINSKFTKDIKSKGSTEEE